MKVLFINSLEPNQADFYFLGLRKILGEHSVIEYPFKPLYHCFVRRGALVATDLDGNLVVREDPKSGTLRYAYSGFPLPRIFGILGPRQYEIKDFPDVLQYDLIIIAFLRGATPLILGRILRSSRKTPPIIFIDGEDDCYVRKVYKETKVLKYFKREVLTRMPADIYFYLIRPIRSLVSQKVKISKTSDSKYLCEPFSVALDGLFTKIEPLNITIPDYGFRPTYSDKVYDLSYISNITSPLRVKVYYALRKIAKKHKLSAFIYLGTRFGFGIPWLKYRDIIAKSKLSVAVPGAGFDTLRYWEIPYHGACLVSWRPWIKIPNNFIDGENAAFFRNINELEEKVLYCLKSDRWESMAREGREHFLKYHTPEKRAVSILSYLSP
jgi:hypothetical protein